MRIKIQKYYRNTPYWRTDRVYRKSTANCR